MLVTTDLKIFIMKNIFKNNLSRNEMRNVSGGSEENACVDDKNVCHSLGADCCSGSCKNVSGNWGVCNNTVVQEEM